MLLNSRLLTLPLLVVAPLLIVVTRTLPASGRRRATSPRAAPTRVINSTLTETVEGSRTVEALGCSGSGCEQFDVDIDVSTQAERYTMTLRNVLFLLLGFVYDLPPLLVLIVGRLRLRQRLGDPRADHRRGALRPGPGRAAAAVDPDARPAAGRDRLHHPAARHRVGAAGPRGRRGAAVRQPADGRGPAVRVPDRRSTCCTASTSTCGRASGWRSSGRAGPASRRSAGCCPGSTARGPGR